MIALIIEQVCGVEIRLEHTEGLFSPRGLDRGTRALIESVNITAGQKVLDLGCGSGVVGIYAAKRGAGRVCMCDIDPRAVYAARENARINGADVYVCESDGLSGIYESEYDWILSNPPYQTDFSTAKRFIEKGFNRLKLGGRMALVVKRRAWYENKLRSVFGGARAVEADGYCVLIAEKRQMNYVRGASLRAGRVL